MSSRCVVLTKDGRANAAANLIVMDRDGRRDTVSVMASGMVVHRDPRPHAERRAPERASPCSN